ncbi:MAG TPA: glycosyltransferase [Elusimicrobiota bacterium]|nr:glycosyltransferase [Elusimicrobiota bacterium]
MKPVRFLFYNPPHRLGEYYFRIRIFMEYLDSQNIPYSVYLFPHKGRSVWQIPGFIATMIIRLWGATHVVTCPSPKMLFRMLLFKLMGKKVLIEHYVSYVTHKEVHPFLPVIFDRMSYRLADYVLTHTETMKKEISSTLKYPPARIETVYCSVHNELFHPPSPDEKSKIKGDAGLGGKFIVLYHGMYHPWHGWTYLLEAAEQLKNEAGIHFIFIPNETFKNTNNMSFFEEQKYDRLPKFVAMADLWCSGFDNHPRGDRSLSSTMLQALLTAVPVLTSPNPEKSRFLKDSETAFFVPPRDTQSIAEKILWCFHNRSLAEQVGQAGYRMASKTFHTEHYHSVYGRFLRRQADA